MNDHRKNTVIFEYNENERLFHENIGDHKENTNGYKTVCETHYHIWDPFRKMIDRNYTLDCHVPFSLIKNEWEDYMVLRNDIEESDRSVISNG